MLFRISACLCAIALVPRVAACDDGSPNVPNTPGATDRGGPDSLTGFSWNADPVSSGGVDFDFSFKFTATQVEASNTCNDAVTATVSSPVRYRYAMTVTESASKTEVADGKDCEVAISPGSLSFEVKGSELHANDGTNDFVFTSTGAVQGLYGTWSTPAAGVGTLSWRMGGGKVTATAACDNGLTATATASATFINYLDILETVSDSMNGAGLDCEVGIQAGTSEYTFDGNDLVLTTGGVATKFARK